MLQILPDDFDIENDYLAIYRDMQGKFKSFTWFSAKEWTKQEIEKSVKFYNKQRKPEQMELVTDTLVREICAEVYRQRQDVERHLRDVLSIMGRIT